MEGRIGDFFRGLFGRSKKPEEDYEELEEEEEEDEDDFVEDEEGGGNPFVRDGKLYGQDFDKLKVTISLNSELPILPLFHIYLIYMNIYYELNY